MKTLSPDNVVTQLFNAINQGDLDAAIEMYEPNAAIVAQPGVVVTGTTAVREAIGGFVALKATLTNEAVKIVEAGEVALCCSRWTLRGTDPAGNPVHMSGRSSDILRRQPDGNWLIAVDNPWGTDIVA